MGMDLALGGLALLMAIRGWLKGFILQAIRLAGLVACVYAADPVRDLARPRVLPYLPTIRPELIDRMLWWSSATASYFLMVGLASLAVKIYRRQPYGMAEPNRNDQLGGAMLGLAKGLVLVAFVASGVQKYALESLKKVPWGDEQARTSQILAWSAQYQPAARIWSATPVQVFVGRIKRMGLNSPSTPAPAAESPALQTAIRTPKLQMAPGLDPEVAEAVEAFKEELRKAKAPE